MIGNIDGEEPKVNIDMVDMERLLYFFLLCSLADRTQKEIIIMYEIYGQKVSVCFLINPALNNHW